MLIGLSGRAGSGKDQSYEYVREWAESKGLPVRRDGFADRLKLSAALALGYQGSLEECVAICNEIKQEGWRIEVVEPSGDVHFISGREYLQFYGTEAHREVFAPDFWVSVVMDRYEPGEVLVVTDVRFPNEAEAIRSAGGQVWQLVRPDFRLDSAHASEIPLPPELIDRTIANDRTLRKLRKQVRTAVKFHALKDSTRMAA